MPYDLIIDVVVAVLLIVTIIYAVMLNNRLRAMRRDRAKLEKIANDFAKSTEKANDSIISLKSANESLQRQLNSANALRDDLAYLLDRGEKTADRLEDLVRVARDDVGISPVPTPRGDSASDGEAMPAGRGLGGIRPGVSRDGTDVPQKGAGTKMGSESRQDFGDDNDEHDAEEALLRAIRSAS